MCTVKKKKTNNFTKINKKKSEKFFIFSLGQSTLTLLYLVVNILALYLYNFNKKIDFKKQKNKKQCKKRK